MSDDNVINVNFTTGGDLPPDRVLQAAIDEGLSGVVVLGYDKDGNEYMASSYADGQVVGWLLDRCKFALLKELDRMIGEGE